MRNAQTGAPELVARIRTRKRARRAEVEWPTRYTKAKRSRGLMARPQFWRKREIFLCAPGTCARASTRGVVRGLGQLNMAAAAPTTSFDCRHELRRTRLDRSSRRRPVRVKARATVSIVNPAPCAA